MTKEVFRHISPRGKCRCCPRFDARPASFDLFFPRKLPVSVKRTAFASKSRPMNILRIFRASARRRYFLATPVLLAASLTAPATASFTAGWKESGMM